VLAANLGTYRFMSAITALTGISQLTLEFVNIVSRPTARLENSLGQNRPFRIAATEMEHPCSPDLLVVRERLIPRDLNRMEGIFHASFTLGPYHIANINRSASTRNMGYHSFIRMGQMSPVSGPRPPGNGLRI